MSGHDRTDPTAPLGWQCGDPACEDHGIKAMTSPTPTTGSTATELHEHLFIAPSAECSVCGITVPDAFAVGVAAALKGQPAASPSVTEPETPAAPRAEGALLRDLDYLMDVIVERASNAEYHQAKDILLRLAGFRLRKDLQEAAALAARPALDVAHPPCPAGCGCRLWTEDADVVDCGCDGPCCWMDWDQYMEDVLDRPDYYREMMVASGRLASLPTEPEAEG